VDERRTLKTGDSEFDDVIRGLGKRYYFNVT
jgi:hypothetical protein